MPWLSARSVAFPPPRRLALTRPEWEPSIHAMWPVKFKAAARLLLLASSCRQGMATSNGSRDANLATAGSIAAHGSSAGTAANVGSSSSSGASVDAGDCPLATLSPDALLEVLRQAAYPVSAWV